MFQPGCAARRMAYCASGLVFGLLLAACAPLERAAPLPAPDLSVQPDRRQVDTQRAAELIHGGGVQVIDVRTPEEITQTGLLADAVNVSHTDIDGLRRVLGEDRNRPVVLYCRTGRRVGLAIEALEQYGYAALVNGGGYEELAAALEPLSGGTD